MINSGIYKIICLINNKFYIGSSVNIDKRLRNHKRSLRKNSHDNKYLQNAWNKYGEHNFRFEIIETIHDIKQLLIREQWWLDNTECYKKEIGFNIATNVTAPTTGKLIDLTGQKFGILTAMKYLGRNKGGDSLWQCGCDCGETTIVTGNKFKSGHTKSCGCLKNKIKHGYGKRNNNKISSTYSSWLHIKRRKSVVCERWSNKKNGFENFLKDMGESPGGEYSIERINKNEICYKENCKWSTSKEQSRNKLSTRMETFNGDTLCRTDMAIKYNINKETLRYRLDKLGWSIKKALLTPGRDKKNNE